MIATERREKTYLISTHQQLAVAPAEEAADVAADKRFPGKTERRKHWNVQSQRVPGAVGIPGPHCRVALDAGESGPCNYVGPLVRLQPLEPFVGSTSLQQRKHVSIFRMR